MAASHRTVAARALAQGDRLGNFRIESLIGRGGMGLVYRALQARPERVVALKVIAPEFAENAGFRARFEAESATAARIEHPNVIPIYEVGEEDGLLYIVMRFVDGIDLGQVRRREGRLEPRRATRLVAQVAGGLDAAHALGLVHRDVKPGNVLIGGSGRDEHAYLTDFGLAKLIAGGGRLTRTGQVVGSLDYIAPEQLSGDRVDARSDVYALGCMLYELVAGAVPFPRETDVAKMFAHFNEAPPRLSEALPDVPMQLEEVVAHAMAKDPAERYGSAAALASAAIAAVGQPAVAREERSRDIRPVVRSDAAEAAAAIDTTGPSARSNLPATLSSFVGRDRELAELRPLLLSSRLLTLTGPGGVGKTRLALRLAAERLPDLDDGAWLIDFTPVSDPALVPGTVASALRVRDDGSGPRLDRLIDTLRNQAPLLLFDNCEHVVEACASLAADLLRASPGVSVLATSREPLRVEGEQTYRVRPLSMPAVTARGARAADVRQFEAVRLFVERVRSHEPTFVVSDENASQIASVCQSLDGIPLALELAAARLRAMSLRDLEKRLDQRFRLLTGGRRSAARRQQTLLALVEWSYEQLSESERLVLSRSSVFAGGFTVEGAETICAGDGVGEEQILDLLASLVDKSLVQVESSDAGVRYRLLETIRQYAAAERLRRGEGEDHGPRQRHATYYASLAEKAAEHLVGPRQAEWLARLDEEHDNLREALATSLADPPGSVRALRLAIALRWYWHIRGFYREGADAFDAALARDIPEADRELRARAGTYLAGLLIRLGDYAPARARLNDAASSIPGDPPEIRAEILDALSLIHDSTGASELALRTASDAVGIAREAGQHHLLGRVLNVRALVSGASDPDRARADYAEAIRCFEAAGDQRHIAIALNNLATLELQELEIPLAREHLQSALPIAAALGDDTTLSVLWHNSGLLAIVQHDAEEAREFFVKSLDVARHAGDRSSLAYSVLGLALAATESQRYDDAAILHGIASLLVEELGESFQPFEQQLREASTHALREHLGERAFANLYGRGNTLHAFEAMRFVVAHAADADASPDPTSHPTNQPEGAPR